MTKARGRALVHSLELDNLVEAGQGDVVPVSGASPHHGEERKSHTLMRPKRRLEGGQKRRPENPPRPCLQLLVRFPSTMTFALHPRRPPAQGYDPCGSVVACGASMWFFG